MTTMQELYAQIGSDRDTGEYDRLHAAKVAEIADYIRPYLRAEVSVEGLAEVLMARIEERGWDGDEGFAEVAPRYTRSGNPLPFTI